MEHSENTCPVCSEQMEIYSVGVCDHPICYKCATRMRALCQQMYCPICRTELPQVAFVNKVEKYQYLHLRSWNSYRKFQIFCQDKNIKSKVFELLDHKCPICKDRPADRYLKDLTRHMRREHEMFYCDLCVEHLKIFSHERKFYGRKQLAVHRREGDPEDTAYKGHPLCRFCDVRFLDNDELARHLRKEHYYCHFCDTDGSHQYYSEYPVLMEHFREQHYLCEEGECIDAQFTHAFRSEIDLKAHWANCHSRGMKRSFTKQARTIDVEFPLAPRSREFDRGRARRGQGRRDQDNDDDRYGYEDKDMARAIEASLVQISTDQGTKKEKRGDKPGRYRKTEQKEQKEESTVPVVHEEKLSHDSANFPTLSGKSSPTVDKPSTNDTAVPSSDSGDLSDSTVPSMAQKLAMSERFSVQTGVMSTNEFPSLKKAATVPSPVPDRRWVGGRNSPVGASAERDFPALGKAARPAISTASSQCSPKITPKTSYAKPKTETVTKVAYEPERPKPTPVPAIPAYQPPAYQPERPKPTPQASEVPKRQKNSWSVTPENDFPGLPQPALANNTGTIAVPQYNQPNTDNKREKDFPGLPAPLGTAGKDFPSLPSSSRSKTNNRILTGVWSGKQSKGQVVGVVRNSRGNSQNNEASFSKPSTLADIGKALHNDIDYPILGGKNVSKTPQPPAKVELEKKAKRESDCSSEYIDIKDSSKSKNKTKKKKQKEKENSDLVDSEFGGYPECLIVNTATENAKTSKSMTESKDEMGENKENNNGISKNSGMLMTQSGQSSSSEKSDEPWILVQPTKLPWTMVDSMDDFPSLAPLDSKKHVPPGFETSPLTKPPPGFTTKISPSRPPPGLGKPVVLSTSNVMQPTGIENITNLDISGDILTVYSKPEGFSERNKGLITEIRTILGDDEDKFDLFKTWSGEFRQATLSAAEYYEKCAHLLGRSKYLTIFPELLALLPDIEKQQELLSAHTASEKHGVKAGGMKSGAWNTTSSLFTSCPFCFQVLVSEDNQLHVSAHDVDGNFPMLVSAEPRKERGLSAWVRTK